MLSASLEPVLPCDLAPVALAAEPAPMALDDSELVEELAGELGCEAEPPAIAERIAGLVALEERLQELFDFSNADDLIEQLEELQAFEERAAALDPLQDALGLTDTEIRLIASAANPEWAVRGLLRRPAGNPQLRVVGLAHAVVEATVAVLERRRKRS